MNNIRLIVRNMVPNNTDLYSLSSSEIVEHICDGIYKEDTYLIRDKEILKSIPQLIRDCVLLIDFDTEINMNGIFGYLENSTGQFIELTVEVLERIGAVSDAICLNNIMKILNESGLMTSNLYADVQNLEEYQVSNFSQTHGNIDSELLKKIEQEAEHLYIYSQDLNIFDNLFDYIEANKQCLINELKEFL